MGRTRCDCSNKTRLIYNNINTPRVKALSESPAMDFGHKFKIGFVGNLYEEGKIKCYERIEKFIFNWEEVMIEAIIQS